MVGAYTATLDLVAPGRRRRTSSLAQDNLRIEWVDDQGPVGPRLPAARRARCTCSSGLLGLRRAVSVKVQAIRMGLAVRFGRRPDGPHPRRVLPPLRPGRGGAAAPLGPAGPRHPERAGRARRGRPLPPRLRGGVPARPPRVPARLPAARVGGPRSSAWPATSRTAAGSCDDGRWSRRSRSRRPGCAACASVPAPRDRAASQAGRTHALRASRSRRRGRRGALRTPSRSLAARACCARPALRRLAELLRGSPIVSVELWLDRVVVDRAMVGLRDCEVEWVFDKGRLLRPRGRAPAPGLHRERGAPQRAADRTRSWSAARGGGAQPLLPGDGGGARRAVARPARAERDLRLQPRARAARCGPGRDTPSSGLFLAGDWTDTGLPATIEGAVRAGVAPPRRAGGPTTRGGA